MLRESLLNSLFTSSIPPTSLTVRVTLLLFFFSSLLSLSCVPSIFLPPILFPHAWLHTCVFVYFIEAPCKHVIGEGWEEGLRACMCNAVYVEPSHLPQKSLQSPGTCSLLLFNTALCKCGCHSWSTSSENGGSLFFWYTVLLKSPLKKNTLTEKSQKKQGNDMQQGLDIVWLWNISSRGFWCDAVWYSTRWILIPQHLGYDSCVCLVCRGVLKAHAFPCRAHAPRTCKISSSESLHKRKCSSSPSSFSAHCRLAGWATPSPAPDRQSALTLWWSCLTIYGDEIAGLSLRPLVRPWGPKPQNQAKP